MFICLSKEFNNDKKDEANHGLGIAIIKEITAKYNGSAAFKAGEKYFLAVVSLELGGSRMMEQEEDLQCKSVNIK